MHQFPYAFKWLIIWGSFYFNLPSQLPQIVSTVGIDPILAGIHAEIKSLLRERLYLSRFIKVHKKKENNAFGFCIIRISQSYCFYLTIYVFTAEKQTKTKKKKTKQNKNKTEKGLTKLICSFGNVTDQTECVKEATIVSWLS